MERYSRFRLRIAVVLVVAGFVALLTLGWSGISAIAGDVYGYGYNYNYEYQYTTGNLTVIKHVANDDGGGAAASDFTITINGVTATGGNSFPGAESPGTTKEVTPGSYSVTETGPSGYNATFSAGCTGSIAAGDNKTCTITNNDQAAHLIVIKHVVNVNSGKATASQFSMKINGITVQSTNPFPGAESPGTTRTVNAGSYTVTETGPSGYILVPSAGCSGTIAPGQTITCTMLNHDIAPRLTIGYWKTHRAQTTALLPQKLGNYTVATWSQALAVLNATNCSTSSSQNAIGCLAGQLLAAELNIANFASPCIQATINKANTFLKGGTVTVSGKTAAGVNYVGPSGTYNLTSTQRAIAVALSTALNNYNNNSKTCSNP